MAASKIKTKTVRVGNTDIPLAPSRGTMIVRLREDDPGLGLKKGELFEVYPYWIDPSKVTIHKRLTPRRKQVEANLYRSQVERVS